MTLPYAKWPFERALAGISRVGYRYVAFGLPHAEAEVPEEDERVAEQLLRLFDTYRLTPVMLIGNKQLAPSQPLDRAYARLRMAKALGIDEVISVGEFGYRKFPHDPFTPEEMEEKSRAFVEHFRHIAEMATRLDIIVTLKPHTGNTATAVILRQTLEQIGSPSVKACYDPGNVQFYEGIPADRDMAPLARSVHSVIAKDHRGERANREFPVVGTGDVRFPELFRQLKGIGFDGSVVVERVDGPADPDAIDRLLVESRENVERLLQGAGLIGE
jgi:sugar phosphate isomerase/epimerase